MEIHFEIKTSITDRNYLEVFNQFDSNLFIYLTKGHPIKLLKFEGSKLHNEIHLEFPFQKKWVSIITEEEISDSEAFFVDKGTTLPFGLKKWKHKHIVRKSEKGCEIIDAITYSCNSIIHTYFMFLPLYIPMIQRISRYKRYFK